MPSAESLATSEVSKGSGHGTWNVPATLENDERAFQKTRSKKTAALNGWAKCQGTGISPR
jgi:hypothetical protein